MHRRDDGVASDASISSVGSPVGEAPLTFPMNISRQNGRTPHGLNTSTPHRTHGHGASNSIDSMITCTSMCDQ